MNFNNNSHTVQDPAREGDQGTTITIIILLDGLMTVKTRDKESMYSYKTPSHQNSAQTIFQCWQVSNAGIQCRLKSSLHVLGPWNKDSYISDQSIHQDLLETLQHWKLSIIILLLSISFLVLLRGVDVTNLIIQVLFLTVPILESYFLNGPIYIYLLNFKRKWKYNKSTPLLQQLQADSSRSLNKLC